MKKLFYAAFVFFLSLFVYSCVKDSTPTIYNTWHTFTTKDSLVCASALCIAVDSDNNKWIGTSNGVSFYDSTLLKYYDEASSSYKYTRWRNYIKELVNVCVNSIVIDIDKNVWFGTRGGLSKFDGTNWTHFTTKNGSGLINDIITCMSIDKDGIIWIGTVNGISKFDGKTVWQTITTVDGLPSNYIYTIYVDNQNNKWIGTQQGLTLFNGSTLKTFTTADGMMNNSVYSVAIDTAGVKWVGTGTGLSKLSKLNNIWTNYATINPASNNYLSSIAIDKSNRKWIATNGLGVWLFIEPNWAFYNKSIGLAFNTVNAVIIDRYHQIWFATGEGITRYIP